MSGRFMILRLIFLPCNSTEIILLMVELNTHVRELLWIYPECINHFWRFPFFPLPFIKCFQWVKLFIYLSSFNSDNNPEVSVSVHCTDETVRLGEVKNFQGFMYIAREWLESVEKARSVSFAYIHNHYTILLPFRQIF